jgi:beta-xylosidase
MTSRGGRRRLLLLAVAVLFSPAPSMAENVPSVVDGGDPTLIRANGRWWMYRTGGGAGALEALVSDDLKTWRTAATLLTKADIPWIGADGARRHSLWAPDMVQANGRWYFYYSVGPQNPTPSRIGVAVCKGPAGPCTDSGRPLLTGGDGFEAIDPMVFRDPASGKTYMYAGGSAGAKLRVFELSPTMTRIAREIKVAQPPHFTEGAFMHRRGRTYYLSYSRGRYNASSYQVHYATAPSPIGPWTYRGAILKSDATYKGPGHHSFVRDPATGDWLIAYHRWEGQLGDGPYKGSRRIAIQRITYRPDGTIAPISMAD